MKSHIQERFLAIFSFLAIVDLSVIMQMSRMHTS